MRFGVIPADEYAVKGDQVARCLRHPGAGYGASVEVVSHSPWGRLQVVDMSALGHIRINGVWRVGGGAHRELFMLGHRVERDAGWWSR
jgi:hypothetical protein